NFSAKSIPKQTGRSSLIATNQFFGIDIKPFAVELAKVTLLIGKKLALKGPAKGLKKIYTQYGNNSDAPWTVEEVEIIPSSVTAKCDVTSALHISANRNPKTCLEGQQPGHKGFCIDEKRFEEIKKSDPDWQAVIKPFLNGDDFISGKYKAEPAWVIDLGECDIFEAKKHRAIFEHLQETVLPDWSRDAEQERQKTGKTTGEHQNRLQRWWLLKRRRGELITGIEKLSRYVICSAVTKRPIFDFISSDFRPSNALKAFLFEDDYSYGILQSALHWSWFTAWQLNQNTPRPSRP
ncbi:MAG TPA: hypothetical protein VGX70_22170, partial [Gemmataceae bacterium]|nr:hypothetical protein [Gemmataceae bacterium]